MMKGYKTQGYHTMLCTKSRKAPIGNSTYQC